MSNVLKSADEVRKLAKMFKSLGDVVEVLDRVGSVEQAEQEALARIEKLKAESANVNASISAAHVEADRILAEAKAERDRLVDEAIEAAHKLQAQAGDELAEAKAKAKQITDAADEKANKAEDSAAQAEARQKAAVVALAEVEKEAEKVRAYLAKIKGV